MSARRTLLALASTLVLASAAAAQTRDTARLPEVIVTATRTPTASEKIGSSADLIDSTERRRRQIGSLMGALQLLNGGAGFGAGAAGAVTSFFLRGAASTQTLILVDGVRLNDSNLSPGSFLGGTDLDGSGQLEVVRGPQSTLYGGAAIGGVVALDAAPGGGSVRGSVQLEGGWFGTWRTSGGVSGGTGGTRYAVSLSANGTDNTRHPNQWHQRTQLVRIDQRIFTGLDAGATFRGLQQEYDSPGDLRSSNTTPSSRTTFENQLATLWFSAIPLPAWRTRLLFGGQEHFTKGSDRYNGGPVSSYSISGSRRVLDWQHNIRVTSGATLVAGVNREWSTVSSDGSALDERLWAFYADLQFSPTRTLTVTGGARSDNYTTFDDATTWRVTGAWRIAGGSTKVRASIGTGFAPPSLAARFGSVYQNPNPDIRPERAQGWDAGVDRVILGGRGSVSATWFHNSLTDLIGWESAPYPQLGTNVNIDKARTSGVEVSGRVLAGAVDARLAWTTLSAVSLSEPDPDLARLIRRPRHTIVADVTVQATSRGTIGAGAFAVVDREDTDFNAFPAVRVDPGDYLVARLYASYGVGSRVTVRARAENLFNRRYEPVYGFPALERSFIASAAMRF